MQAQWKMSSEEGVAGRGSVKGTSGETLGEQLRQQATGHPGK